jgi:hypothetical protein
MPSRRSPILGPRALPVAAGQRLTEGTGTRTAALVAGPAVPAVLLAATAQVRVVPS